MNRRNFMQASLAMLASTAVSCVITDKPNAMYPHTSNKNWMYKDYTFDITTPKDIIVDINGLPKPHPEYKPTYLRATNQQGQLTTSMDIIKKSLEGPKAIRYVEKGLDDLEKLFNKGHLNPKNLAKTMVNRFHKDISMDCGNGYDTTNHERFFDSMQTFDEFMSHGKKYEGDCEDFTVALMTAYEIAREQTKQSKTKFSNTLYQQLLQYQIVGMAEIQPDKKIGHAINALIKYNNNFKKGTIIPIEPRKFKPKRLIQSVIVDGGKELTHIIRQREYQYIVPKIYRVGWFFNSTGNYLTKL